MVARLFSYPSYAEKEMKKHLLTKSLFALAAMLMCITNLKAQEAYAVLSDEGKTVTFYYDTQKTSRGGIDINSNQISYEESSPYGSATNAVIDASIADYYPTSTAYWFKKCSSLASIAGLENLKTENVKDMSEMFDGCSKLTSIDVSSFKTDNVTDMGFMFEDCYSLTSLDVSGFKTHNVMVMTGLFENCSSLTSLDLSSFETDNVTEMGGMFYGCSKLTSIDVSGFKTENVKDMSWMFRDCSSLTSLDLSGFKTENVKDMSWMFRDCSSLTSLDLSGFKTDNVTDMGYMFYGCSKLISIDVSGFKTENVKDMGGMFEDCSSLTSLDLSGFKTDNVTDMSYMFYGCSSLETIYAADGWSTTNVTRGSFMFYHCYNLIGGLGTIYNPLFTDYTYAHIDRGAESPGYFSVSGQPLPPRAYAVLSDGGRTVTFYYDTQRESRKGITINMAEKDSHGYSNVTAAIFDPSFSNYYPTNTYCWFYHCSNLTHITGIENINTNNVIEMASMFGGCSKLTTIDVSGFKTDNVTTMAGMFAGCENLTTLDLSSFKTDNVTDMSYMFYGCSKLISIDVSGFKTENVKDMGGMFEDCSSLTSLDLSGFKTDNVKDMGGMFEDCSSLTSLDLSGFKTDNVTDMGGMFYGCSSLTSLDLSSFKTDKVTDMSYMFYGCSYLQTIYASEEWSTVSVIDGFYMFIGCEYLVGGQGTEYNLGQYFAEYARIDGGEESPGYFTASGQSPHPVAYAYLSEDGNTVTFYYDMQKPIRKGVKINNVLAYKQKYIGATTAFIDASFADYRPKSTACWFSECSKLTTITGLENLKTDNVTDMSRMFYGCSSLTSLDLSSFKTDNVTNMSYMFYDCSYLQTIYASKEWSTVSVTDGAYMFTDCELLVGGQGTEYDRDNIDFSYARIDDGDDAPGYFTASGQAPHPHAYAVLSNNRKTVTFYYDRQMAERKGVKINYHSYTTPTYANATSAIIDASLADYRPKSTACWFSKCSKLTTITGLGNLKTDNVTDMSWMFYGCSSLTSLDLSGFKTDNVTDMDFMFDGCSNLNTIYAGDGWSTTSVTTGSMMFYDCKELVGGKGTVYNGYGYSYARIDGGKESPGYFTASGQAPYPRAYVVLTNDGKTVTFYHDSQKVTRGGIDLSKSPKYTSVTTAIFDASFADYYPTSTAYWFDDCYYLTSVSGLENLKTDNVTNMSCMFSECQKLISLDLSGFNTANVMDMSSMFSGCYNLQTIYVGDGWSTASVTKGSDMFNQCEDIIGGQGTLYDPSNTDYTYAHIDRGNESPGYFSTLGQPQFPRAYAVLNEEGNTVTFYYDLQKLNRKGIKIDNSYPYPYGSVTTVVIDASLADYYPTSTAHWFMECSSLASIAGLENLNTDNVTDMSYMFYGCSSLTSLDLSNLKTDNLTDMSCMFRECSNLTNLNLSSFKTDNVTDMSWMFYECSSIKSLDLSGFNTNNVTNMEYMFGSCSDLQTIYAGDSWSIANVTRGVSTFSLCKNLTGGQGTTYDKSHTNYIYARIDGGPSNPGYFTYKASTGINSVVVDSGRNNSLIYNLSGQRLTTPQKGINIINGKKVVIK